MPDHPTNKVSMNALLYKDNIIRAVQDQSTGALDALVNMWIDYVKAQGALRRLHIEPWTNMVDGIYKLAASKE
jgi:hypothetical protein